MRNEDLILYYKELKDNVIVTYGDLNKKKLPKDCLNEIINIKHNQYKYYQINELKKATFTFLTSVIIASFVISKNKDLSKESLMILSNSITAASLTYTIYSLNDLYKNALLFTQITKEEIYMANKSSFDEINNNKEEYNDLKRNVKSVRKRKKEKIEINDLHKIRLNDLVKTVNYLNVKKVLKERNY